jgi:hypothetical protein
MQEAIVELQGGEREDGKVGEEREKEEEEEGKRLYH